MAYSKTRGFFAKRKHETAVREKTVETKIQKLDKKGNPILNKNGEPEFIIKEEKIKEQISTPLIIRVNNAVPFDHWMLK